MTYETRDLVLPMLGLQGLLPDPCPICLTVTDADVKLYVGPRDWQWDRATAKIIGAGTRMSCPQPEEPGTRP